MPNCCLLALGFSMSAGLLAQSTSRSFVEVIVVDGTGSVLPGADVRIDCSAANFRASGPSDNTGTIRFLLVPFSPCNVAGTASGFDPARISLNVAAAGLHVKLSLTIAKGRSEISVVDVAPNDVDPSSTASTNLDQNLLSKLPNQSTNSSFSSALTLGVAGVSGDANGVFHVLGEHAEASFSIDNQPISDQQSRIFSNQLSLGAVQSVQVINGSPPAEFGDKTSLIVQTVTRSGLGFKKPMGSVTAGYGSFGTPSASVSLGYGGDHFGNFLNLDGLNSGRFLDTPEVSPLHAHGNLINIFDRFDYQPGSKNAFHLNITASRSWFQVPNDYDQQFAGQDQKQQTRSFNIAPSYTHILSPRALTETNLWLRQDRSGYFPSQNLFSDSPAFLSQNRRLTNAGGRATISFSAGAHTVKAGLDIHDTVLRERFQTGITDANFNAPCLVAAGVPAVTSIRNQGQCASAGYISNDAFLPALLPVDLTRGGSFFRFSGQAGVLQESGFVQDTIRRGAFTYNLGIRYDNYDGISSGRQLQPRLGGSYEVKKTGTVLRASYARVFLTPYNENLVLASNGALGATALTPLKPAYRNQYNAGLQQAFGNWLVIDGEYFWKYTNGAYDFNVLLNTPLNFPIQFRQSKIDGVLLHLSVPERRGFSAFSVSGHSRSRLFGPSVGGISFSAPYSNVVRPDHDQAFQQTTHLRYQFRKDGPWAAFTWRFESGLVSVATPDYRTALALTADEQSQMGLFCGSLRATPSTAIRSCDDNLIGATRVRIPKTGTENDDTNPPRIAMRNTFDIGLGDDNFFRAERYKVRLRLNATNITNKDGLYNFLSSFSGTHFIMPRSYQAELAFTF